MQLRMQARSRGGRSGRLGRAQKQEQTRAALLESAANLFTERGYEGASIEEIAEAAGFSRGAFYSNFAGKDEVFLSLIEFRIERNLQEIALAFQQGDTAAERTRSGAAFLDLLVERDRQWCVLYMEFWARALRNPKLRRRFSRQYETWRQAIAHMIEERYHDVGADLDAPSRELASALIALFEGQVLQRLIDPRGLEREFFSRVLFRFFRRIGALKESDLPSDPSLGRRR